MAKKQPDVQSKKWLRTEVMQSVRFWAAILDLSSAVDTMFVEMDDDYSGDDEYAACVEVDTTTRTATITVSRNIVECYEDRYHNIKVPGDIVSMIMLHECLHIVTHPMSHWASTVVGGSSKENKLLTDLFEDEEEQTVEHFTRVFFGLRDYLEPPKYKGKILYRVKKSKKVKAKEDKPEAAIAAKKKSRRRRDLR